MGCCYYQNIANVPKFRTTCSILFCGSRLWKFAMLLDWRHSWRVENVAFVAFVSILFLAIWAITTYNFRRVHVCPRWRKGNFASWFVTYVRASWLTGKGAIFFTHKLFSMKVLLDLHAIVAGHKCTVLIGRACTAVYPSTTDSSFPVAESKQLGRRLLNFKLRYINN